MWRGWLRLSIFSHHSKQSLLAENWQLIGRQRRLASSSSVTQQQTTDSKLTTSDSYDTTAVVHPKVQQLVDEIIQLNMIQVKQLTQQLKDRLGVSDMPMMAAPMMSMPGAAPGTANATEAKEEAPKKEEKTEFALKLEAFEAAKKIQIIKEVRAFAGLGLKEAKELVEGVPKVIKTGVSKEEGEKMRDKLKELGATVVLE